MFSIRLLGSVNNTEIALQALRRYSGEDGSLALSRLPGNPERNVFLWLLEVTLEIHAPVSWWNQFEQYPADVFPLRHREDRPDRERLLSEKHFEGSISREKLAILNNYIRDGQAETALKLLPANFIQRGYVRINYKSLGDIRRSALPADEEHWGAFLRFLSTLPYSTLITDPGGGRSDASEGGL